MLPFHQTLPSLSNPHCISDHLSQLQDDSGHLLKHELEPLQGFYNQNLLKDLIQRKLSECPY